MRIASEQLRNRASGAWGALSLFSVQFTETNAPNRLGAIRGRGCFRDSFILGGWSQMKLERIEKRELLCRY
jgi:hypothetical protein